MSRFACNILEENKDLLSKKAVQLLEDEVIVGQALACLAKSVQAGRAADNTLVTDTKTNVIAA